MNCLYCDKEINSFTLTDLFIEEDKLCYECRQAMNMSKRKMEIEGLKIEYFYDYNSLFKSILIQYKECFDEALKDVFLYNLKDYIRLKYHGYKIAYVPSTKDKLNKRGFNHLRLIFESLNFKEVEGLKQKEERIQEGKGKRERLKMRDNYNYEGEPLNKVLIVDDVLTTGSSIIGVYNALKDKAYIIKGLVLSKC